MMRVIKYLCISVVLCIYIYSVVIVYTGVTVEYIYMCIHTYVLIYPVHECLKKSSPTNNHNSKGS